jgi:hypothetical protein
MAPGGAILAAAFTPIDFRLAVVSSLPLTVIALVALLRLAGHSEVAGRARAGLLGGAIGIVAYDAVRLALQAVHLVQHPFAAITLYGQSLLPGASAGPTAGWIYHIWNGLAFALFFAVVIARPTVTKAIIWALLLDTLQTLTIGEMPGIAVGQEFLTASIVGHLAYGATLGTIAPRLISHTSTWRS